MDWTPEELKRLRKEAGYTQEDLAPVLGVSLATLRTWEQGVSKPGRMGRRLLSDWLNRRSGGVAA